MEREPVSSSNIAAVGYDADTATLEVEFLKSGIYQYYNVPEFLYEQMMAAGSVGKFFNAEIKHAYACARM